MTDKDYHAHNLDALLDNLWTTLREGYSEAMSDPQGDAEALLSDLFRNLLWEHMVDGHVRIADKVRHDGLDNMPNP